MPASIPRRDLLDEVNRDLEGDKSFELRLYAARELVRAGLVEEARAQLPALEQHPDAAARLADVARVAAEAGDLDAARRIAMRAPHPDDLGRCSLAVVEELAGGEASLPDDELGDCAEDLAVALARAGRLERAARWADRAASPAAWIAVARARAAAKDHRGDAGDAATRAQRAAGRDDARIAEVAALLADLGRGPAAGVLARRVHAEIARDERFYASAADPALLVRAALAGGDRELAQDVVHRLWDSGVTNDSPVVRLQAAGIVLEHRLAPPAGQGADPAEFADRAATEIEAALASETAPVVRDGVLAALARARLAAGDVERARAHAAAIGDPATRVLTRIALAG